MTDDVKRALEADDELTALILRVNHTGVNESLYMDKAERDRHVLAAEVRRLQPLVCEPCETCEHNDYGDCKLSGIECVQQDPWFSNEMLYKDCSTFGNGCRAHKPKEGAK